MATSRKRKTKKAKEEGLTPRLLTTPLESLVFLLPLILFYEIGCLLVSPDVSWTEGQQRVVAFYLLQVFFQLFGSTGAWMPGLTIVVILLFTHAASKQPWKVRRQVIGVMYAESALFALPLMGFNFLLSAEPAGSSASRSILTEAVLGVGAGVYEELVFRLVLISLVSMIGSDLLRLPPKTTTIVAVVVAALAFSAHHHPPMGSEPFSSQKFIFRSLAGLYLGTIFVWRGYGPAAGTHAAYNLFVVATA
ncbi:MAG: CPBP family intramembrane metalloprotease [Planctomycetes bacterium]|nr:CPBP family intramembrane metalloprotease [Planctomycetota bacterium]